MRVALSWARTRKTYLLAALAISLVAVFSVMRVTHAADVGDALDSMALYIIKFIQWIMEGVMTILLFLISLLVSAAQYSNFVNAYPVQVGWSLVRDVVNMFFIVVLLLIAFGTIIGYDALHYRNHLPKLLLMAVLINFSRTLLGVIIDFSQVVMLTFVNGFKAAAGGNFVNMLKLTKVAELSKENITPGGEPKETIGNLFWASILGLAMLVISSAVILILVIYLIARIIGLWIALIFSPIAFFATALPPKIGNALGVFTKDYWGKLSGMLTGGPIVAFFLWLSLATVQGNPSTFSDMYKPNSEKEAAAVQSAITRAAEPDQLQAFVVAIVMLMMGLSAAISSANAVSTKTMALGNLGKNLAIGATKRLAKTSVRAGVGAAKGTGRFFDQTVFAKGGRSLTERMGERALEKAGKGGILSGAYMRAGIGLSRTGAAARAGQVAKIEAMTKGLPPAQRLNVMRAMEASQGLTGSRVMSSELQERRLDIETSGHGKTLLKNEAIAQYYKDNKINPKNPSSDEKRAAEGFAAGKAKRDMADRLSELKTLYEEQGKGDKLDKLKEDIRKDPSLNNDLKDVFSTIDSKDFKEVLKEVKTESYQDAGTAAAIAKSFEFLDESGAPKSLDDIKNGDQWKELARNPAAAKTMENHIKYWSTDAGKAALATQIAAMTGDVSDDTKAAAAAARYSMQGGGTAYYSSATQVEKVPSAPPAHQMAITQVVSNLPQQEQVNFQTTMQNAGVNMESFAQRFERPVTPAAASVMTSNAAIYAGTPPAAYDPVQISSMADAQALGASASAAFRYNVEANAYDAPAARAAHVAAYQQSIAALSSDDLNLQRAGVGFVANTDIAALKAGGEMSDVVTSQLEGHLKEVSKNMKVASADQRKRIESLVKEINKAANAALAKGVDVQLSDTEKRLVKMRDEISKDKKLSKMAGTPTEED